MKQQRIIEEMAVHREWFKQAKDKAMTMATLPEFLRHLTEDYEHDYGTICHALVAGSVATAWAMNRSEQGGITGFQSGFIMWGFIQHFMMKDGPMRLVEYNNMLFPQYAQDFEKWLDKDTFDHLRKKAVENLEKSHTPEGHAAPEVLEHWKRIAGGEPPFGYRVKP